MPIDMTLPVYLSQEDFVFPPPSRPAVGSSFCVESSDVGSDGRKPKKQVTFADHKGLSLTRVKVFSELSDPIDVPLSVQLSSCPSVQQDRLELDFKQPSSDYLLFRQRLDGGLVCLEHCVLKEGAFAGTVKVKNVSFEKSVKLRVTFDSWRSHLDVVCRYVKDSYPCSYSDTFSFQVSLPAELQLHERVEFAVRYEVDGGEYWDSNHGNNYRIVWASLRRRQDRPPDSRDLGIHLDRYGSPTCSHGIFPDWPSYAGYENIGPYY